MVGGRKRRTRPRPFLKTPIQRKLRQLQRIVPGCQDRGMDAQTLFHNTANYIHLLELRVSTLRTLLSALHG